ncbi:MAG TPA: hypothetical protein VN521_03895, partial [Negativicutes bacterium]|nr:hypothetical protein [Negativicutes bacterium]
GIQESGNIDYVCQNKLGFHCATPAAACRRILEVAADKPSVLGRESAHIPADGAKQIANIILQHADEKVVPAVADTKMSLGA